VALASGACVSHARTTSVHCASQLPQVINDIPDAIKKGNDTFTRANCGPPSYLCTRQSELVSNISITLPDGAVRSVPLGTTPLDIAQSISQGLAQRVLAARVTAGGVSTVTELTRPLDADARLELLTWDDDDGKSTLWHSSAHILAEAIEAEYPGVKLTIGPPIENGFYYDIDFLGQPFSQPDFEKIEKKFLELARSGETFERRSVSKAEAIAFYQARDNQYKLELIENLTDGDITFYHSGNFVDLCRGPHLANSKVIKAVKILNTAGAYWRGDESRPMLTRVYAISFTKQADLDQHLKNLEEAKKRDHRRLGQELDLFTFSEKVGKGLPLWLPKGTQLREDLEQFLRKTQRAAGYLPVVTPHIGNRKLYETSGHWEKYGKDSFQPILTPEGEQFMLKPMNCPHHCEIYASRPRSYRDLPMRLAEFGTVYRYEQSGELHGLTRVRGFTVDDAHIFCTPEQVLTEFEGVIDIVLYIFKIFGFTDFTAQESRRDPNNRTKYIGSDEQWDQAEAAIETAARNKGLKTVVEYGEAAFYGPKLDFMVRDALGRRWQLGTVQVDYNLPARFELEYVGPDNLPHRPVMIHRAPFGSLERFIAVLLEHTGGELPLWLAPTQAIVLPISDRFNDYGRHVVAALAEAGLRAELDARSEKVTRKIRDAELRKLPFMLVVGEKEQSLEGTSIRRHGHAAAASEATSPAEPLTLSLTDTVSAIRQAIADSLAV
jgi:threonyl-tRNA synthetase